MRLLFRVNLGGELAAGHRGPAEGLGHATRCLALAEALRDLERDSEIRFAVRGPEGAERRFEAEGFAAVALADEAEALRDFRPDATVIDINSADRDLVEHYRSHAPVINLAARGRAKFYADLTFNNSAVDSEAPPADARAATWYRGPRFALIPRRIAALRPGPGQAMARDFSCIASLGGVDRDDMTGTVLRALVEAPALDFPVTVVAGPLNPQVERLRALAARRPEQISLVVDPADFPQRLAAASMGIFGLGGTTDEALTLGVPSLNLGLTRFHELRGAELEAEGVIAYLGRPDEVRAETIVGRLLEWRRDPIALQARRQRALALYDGEGGRRVAETILRFLAEPPALRPPLPQPTASRA